MESELLCWTLRINRQKKNTIVGSHFSEPLKRRVEEWSTLTLKMSSVFLQPSACKHIHCFYLFFHTLLWTLCFTNLCMLVMFQPCRYEEKAKKHLEHHDQRTKLASAADPRAPVGSTPRVQPQGQKRKAPVSNQLLLDKLFSAQPQKKLRNPASKPSQPLPCSMAALRLQLQRLSSQSSAAPQGLRLVNQLASQSSWVILCGQRLMLLNPFRVEEALLFKRLLENNILPAVGLDIPVQLTDG